MLTPQLTFTVLLVVQALHLLHHRVAKRHVSWVEGLAALTLCIPLDTPLPGWLLMVAHLAFCAIQIVGSIWIMKLSPSWEATN